MWASETTGERAPRAWRLSVLLTRFCGPTWRRASAAGCFSTRTQSLRYGMTGRIRRSEGGEIVYYCEACRAKHSWPMDRYRDEPYAANEAITCEECGTANVPCYSNAGWRLPKPVPPPEPFPWRSYNVTALCEAMRSEQDWSNLPILADALED